MKIAITGATGQLGRLVVNKLKEKFHPNHIVALARSPRKGADLGVEVREADYSRPDTLDKALQSIDFVLLISSSEIGKRALHHINVIDAAKKANVKWIVYTSLLHADTTAISLAGEHLATEDALKQSGIPYTILRNGWYTENYTAFVPAFLEVGSFQSCAGEGRISSAARADYADAAVAVLTDEGHKGNTYELAGDESYTLPELAREISQQNGKELPYVNLSEEEYASLLKDFGLPEEFARAFASWDYCASQGDLFDESRQLSRLIGRPTTPYREVVSVALQNAKNPVS